VKAQSQTCTLALCGGLLPLSCALTDPVTLIRIVRGATATIIRRTPDYPGRCGWPKGWAWSPDGQWIAFLRSQTGKVRLAKIRLSDIATTSTAFGPACGRASPRKRSLRVLNPTPRKTRGNSTAPSRCCGLSGCPVRRTSTSRTNRAASYCGVTTNLSRNSVDPQYRQSKGTEQLGQIILLSSHVHPLPSGDIVKRSRRNERLCSPDDIAQL